MIYQLNKKYSVFFATFLLIFFLTSITISLYAEDNNDLINLELISQSLKKTEPKKIVTVTFSVINNSTDEESFYEEISLPAGWQIIGSDQVSFKLKPQVKQIRLVTFFVPISASSGHYEITYLVGSQREYEISKKVTFFIDVLSLDKLEILVEDYPKMIISGQVFEIKFRLINRGNKKAKIELNYNSYPDYPVQTDSTNLNLDPGTSRIIRYNITTDKDLDKKIKYIFNIQALIRKIGTEKKIILDKKTVSLDILPKITGKFDPYHRLPVKIKFVGISDNNKNSFQVQLSGKGSLDEEDKHNIEFLIKEPKISDEIPTGEIDEAFISYSNKLLDLHLGDKSYTLSTLTENSRFGRGVALDLHKTKFNIGVFNFENKLDKLGEKEIGTFFEYFLSNELKIKTNFLNKNKDLDEDNISSIQTNFSPDKNLNFDLEFASNSSYHEKSFNDKAYNINLNGNFSNDYSYYITKTYAGPNFFGYYNDYAAVSSKIYYPIYKKLTGNLSYDEYNNNLNFDPLKNQTSLYEKNLKTNLLYKFTNLDVSLDYMRLLSKDKLLPADFEYEVNSIKLGLKQNFSEYGFNIYLERGMLNDYLINTINDNLESYSIFSYFSPYTNQIYSISGKIGHNSFMGTLLRTKSFGASGGWALNKDAYIRLEYQKNNIDSKIMKEQDFLFSTLNYSLPNNHSLLLRSSWSKYKNEDKNLLVYLGYSINLGIPIRKKKSIGTLKGIIYDSESPAKLPISNALLTLNEVSAVTNQNGEFIFPSLIPGTYHLWIEKIFIGLNRVTTEKLPIVVIVKPGETTEIRIGITTSAKLFGKIAIFIPETKDILDSSDKSQFLIEEDKSTSLNFDSSKLKEIKNLFNIAVELTDGTEFLHQISDDKGNFSFKDIRPGKWILKISEQNLPEYHYLEHKEIELTLKSGEIKDITVKVFHRLRKIHIIEEGEIKQEK